MARGARQKAADIRTSLIEQMQAAGNKPMAYIIDLVDGYMDMWRVREKARADISKRGVDASGNVLVMEMGTGDKLFINFDCVRYAGFEDTVGAVSVNDNEPETFHSSHSRTGRGRQGGNGV